MVTWRTFDSIPKDKLIQYESERRDWASRHPKPWDCQCEREFHRLFSQRVDDWLDNCAGDCVLRLIGIRRIVDSALLHFNEKRYQIIASVVMPNHVHVLMEQQDSFTVGQVVKSWKGFTAREINRVLNKGGSFWGEDYFDRLIRNPQHLDCCIRYILQNPAKARLTDGMFTTYVSSFAQERLNCAYGAEGSGLENPPSIEVAKLTGR